MAFHFDEEPNVYVPVTCTIQGETTSQANGFYAYTESNDNFSNAPHNVMTLNYFKGQFVPFGKAPLFLTQIGIRNDVAYALTITGATICGIAIILTIILFIFCR